MELFFYPAITAFCAAFVTWIFAMRRSLINNKTSELDNAVHAVRYYRLLLDDINRRLTGATETIKKMEKQHNELLLTNQQLVDELQKLKQTDERQE